MAVSEHGENLPNLMLDHQFPMKFATWGSPAQRPSRPSTDLDRQHPPSTGTTCIASIRPGVSSNTWWTSPEHFELAMKTLKKTLNTYHSGHSNIWKPRFQGIFGLPRLITKGYCPMMSNSAKVQMCLGRCGKNPGAWQVLVFNGSAELFLGLLLVNTSSIGRLSMDTVLWFCAERRGDFFTFRCWIFSKILQVRLPLHNLPWVVILRKHAVALLRNHTIQYNK